MSTRGCKTLNMRKIEDAISAHFGEYQVDPVAYHIKYAARRSRGDVDFPPSEGFFVRRSAVRQARDMTKFAGGGQEGND